MADLATLGVPNLREDEALPSVEVGSPSNEQLHMCVREPIVGHKVPRDLVIISFGWPVWLPTIQALKLPLRGVSFRPGSILTFAFGLGCEL